MSFSIFIIDDGLLRLGIGLASLDLRTKGSKPLAGANA